MILNNVIFLTENETNDSNDDNEDIQYQHWIDDELSNFNDDDNED